jgi:hypothetical protein
VLVIAILTNGMILTAVNPYPAARTIDTQHAIAGESVCNGYRLRVEATTIVEGFSDLKITIRFSEGTPNIQACDDIKVTDMAAGRTHR